MTFKTEDGNDKKLYEFEEAIDMTGTGCYNLGLLATLSLGLLAMCLDLFSFSVIVPLCTCDFNLSMTQKSILVSVPFIGPVATAYAWGYISDTQGRRFSLIMGMAVGFVMDTLCAFSPNWIVLAVCKLIGTCFCSCAQSGTFALLGESCPEKIKGKYLLILSSIVHQGIAVYFTLSYLIGHLEFSYDLGFINFVPWRLLVLVLAMPMGICAVALMFFYESPKFLLNIGMEDKALKALKGMHRRNRGTKELYLVDKIVLNEEGNVSNKGESLWKSLKVQTLPLFKPPLLCNTLLLYYLILIPYGVGGGIYVWLPFIASAFSGEAVDFSEGLCSVISSNNTLSSHSETEVCHAIELPLVVTSLISANLFCFLNALMSKWASRKKLLLVLIYIFVTICCYATTFMPNKGAAFAYFGVMSLSLAMGPLFTYYVELYPTSFRGMASCLGVMVARIASVIGINLLGPFLTTMCSYTFYVLGVIVFSGVLMSLLLPPPPREITKKDNISNE